MAAGDAWVEIWSRPGSATFERIAANVPGAANFTKRMAGGIGEGNITVPANWDRINAVIKRVPGTPASDIRTLNRAFIEQVTGAALVKYEWFNDLTDDETDEVDLQIKGPGIESIMADGIVYPWDWDGLDESTSTFPDWIWGGKDIVGPVEATFVPHIIDAWIDAGATGTATIGFSINGGAFQDATVAPGDSAFDVEQAIEALSNITTAEVIGSGTLDTPWQIRILDPDGTYTVAISSGGLSGGRIYFDTVQFGRLRPIGWTISQVGSTTIEHGPVYDWGASFGGGAHPTLPAGCDVWIWFDGGEYLFPGVQKRVRVSPGGIFQVDDDMILYAQGAGAEVRVVIRDLNENLIGFEEITLVANTPTNIVGLVNVMIPAGITEAVFRIGHIGTGDPPPIFIACPNMREGLAPTTAGGIMDALFDDATVNHVADGRVVWENFASVGTSYIDLTFTVTVDSDGVTWDEPELTFTAQRGKTYLQVLTDLNHIGYKWTVTASATPGRWNLNLYNPTWVETDATGLSTPAINVGSGVTGGPIYRSHLTGNVMTVEGAQMQFGRAESTTSIAAIGRREVYQPDKSLLSMEMATLRAAEEVTARLLSGLSVSVKVDPVNGPIPLLDYDVDWLMNVQVPPVLTKSAHRLASITVNIGETTTYQCQFSSEAFLGSQGALEAVRRLMLKFIGLERPEPDAVPTPITGGGGAPTIVVAAADSTNFSKERADLICSGIDDQGTIQSAINHLDSQANFGRVILCEGNYNCSVVGGTPTITLPFGISLLGLGKEVTYILADSFDSGGPASLIEWEGGGYIRDLAFWNNTDPDITAIEIKTGFGNLEVESCRFDCDGKMVWGTGSNANVVISQSIFSSGDIAASEACIHMVNAGRWVIRDNEFFAGRNAIRGEEDCGSIHIHGNYGEQIGEEAVCFIPAGGTFSGEAVKVHHNSFLGGGFSGTFSGILIDTTNAFTDSGLGFDVDHNTFESFTKYGIELVDAYNCRLIGNYVEESGRHGIALTDSTDCTINDNDVWRAGQETDDTYDGIFLAGNSDTNQIQDNRIVSFTTTPQTRYGINISVVGCNNNVVNDNVIGPAADFGTGIVNNAGTGTQGTNFTV